MSEFKKYVKTGETEMRPVTGEDIKEFGEFGKLHVRIGSKLTVSISDEDLENGSPKIGDMIARNPDNHNDQWLVAEEYFKHNYK